MLLRQRRRDGRAPLSGPIEVLQCDERGVDARQLRLERVIQRVSHFHGRVVYRVARNNVLNEMLTANEHRCSTANTETITYRVERRLVWWAGTGYLDRLSIRPVDGTITVTGP